MSVRPVPCACISCGTGVGSRWVRYPPAVDVKCMLTPVHLSVFLLYNPNVILMGSCEERGESLQRVIPLYVITFIVRASLVPV